MTPFSTKKNSKQKGTKYPFDEITSIFGQIKYGGRYPRE